MVVWGCISTSLLLTYPHRRQLRSLRIISGSCIWQYWFYDIKRWSYLMQDTLLLALAFKVSTKYKDCQHDQLITVTDMQYRQLGAHDLTHQQYSMLYCIPAREFSLGISLRERSPILICLTNYFIVACFCDTEYQYEQFFKNFLCSIMCVNYAAVKIHLVLVMFSACSLLILLKAFYTFDFACFSTIYIFMYRSFRFCFILSCLPLQCRSITYLCKHGEYSSNK